MPFPVGLTLRRFSLLSLLVLCPQQGEIVELPSGWEVGEHYRIELVRSKHEFRGDRLIQYDGSKTTIEVEVTHVDEESYVFRWTMGKTELLDEQTIEHPMLERITSLSEGLVLDLRTDDLGTPVALENLEQVGAFYREIAAELSRNLQGDSDPLVAKALRGVQALLKPGAVEIISLKDPGLFYLPIGGSYELGARHEYEDLLPNPFGGEPFPSRAYFHLKKHRPEEDLAVIVWKQELEPEKAREIIVETFNRLAQGTGSAMPKAEDLPSIAIDDSAEYQFDLKSGWPRSVKHRRVIEMRGRRRVDSNEFTVIFDH